MSASRTCAVALSFSLAAVASAEFGWAAQTAPSSPGGAPAGAQDVLGVVKDSTGGALIGASLTLQAAVGDFHRDTSTDTRGRYRFQNVPPGGYVLLVTKDGFASVTKEMKVSGSEPTPEDITLSPASFSEEVTVSFTGAHSVSALKSDTPVRDIPLSVQSYTSSFMKAIETASVADLYNYTIGVARAGNTAVDFTIRGLTAGTAGQNIQYNGLPGLAARFGSPSTENVERIEVLKGPTSVLYGQAKPGGVINIVTKKPQAERAEIFDIRGGTYFGTGLSFADDNKYHLAADVTGPIGGDRRLLYRVVGAYDSDQTFRRFAKDTDLYVVPSLSWLGWEGAVLNVELEYRRTRNANDSGLVPPNNDITLIADRTVRYQEPKDYLNENGKTLSLSLNKLFANGFNWNVNWRSVWHDDDTNTFENLGTSGLTIVTRRDRHQINNRRYDFFDTGLKKTVSTGPIRHNFLLGLNGGYELQDFDRLQFSTNASLNVDLYNPVYGAPGLPIKPDSHRHTTFWNYGTYLNDQIEISPKWKALAGVRYDQQDSRQEELRINPNVSTKTNRAVLPLAGLVFEPDHTWSLYGSYSTSFTPAAAGIVDINGNNPFKPERGRQFEAGVKADFGNGRGEVTLALFHLTRDDVLITVVAGAINDQIGQEQSKGFELSANYKILNTWQTIAGFAFTDAKVTKDADPARIGSQTLNAPRNAANLWTRYDIPSGPLRGLGFGLGLVYSSDRAGSVPASTSRLPVLKLPGYFRADAGLYYVSGRYELTARIVNLFDTVYYEGALTTVTVRPGAPRSATLSMRLRL